MWLNLHGLTMEEKIEKCIKEGMTFKQIKLACGNPSTKEIKTVMEWADPKMYQLLNDTESLKKYRDRLYQYNSLKFKV